MIKYPIEFISETTSTSGVNTNWTTKSQFDESQVSVPPEFMGPGGALSPEDLFNHALANCFVATFKVYAENSKLTFSNLHAESKLIVDIDENKKPVMKEFYLTVKIENASNIEKANLLAKKASESGFILNSVKTKCFFDFQIN